MTAEVASILRNPVGYKDVELFRLLTRRWQAIVGGNLVCRVGELKANFYHFIQTRKPPDGGFFDTWIVGRPTIHNYAPCPFDLVALLTSAPSLCRPGRGLSRSSQRACDPAHR